ncbi:bacterial regulatory s, tetR family protein, partial [Bacteroides fragilis str. S13 L11]|uniref:TetR/AcrR family transcriptional regulator n=1 Tax=Bacteroides fragilis TaxID=817 RepID=UPI00044EFCC0
MKKVDKNQWFIVGLDVLGKEGFARITIDNLCGLLQITKGAFYHHFKNLPMCIIIYHKVSFE